MKNFLCTKCNQKHPIFTTIELSIPKNITLKLLSGEFKSEKSERWAIINTNTFLIKGIFFLFLKNKKERNSILAWIRVKEDEFWKYIHMLKEKKEERYQGNGELFSELNYFNSSNGANVIFTYNSINEFPKIDFLDKSSSLYYAQVNGMVLQEIKEFMMDIFHGYSVDTES